MESAEGRGSPGAVQHKDLGLGRALPGQSACLEQPAHGWAWGAVRTLPPQPFYGSVILKDPPNPNYSL